MSSWVVCKVERVVLTCCVIRLMSSGLRSVREGIKAFFKICIIKPSREVRTCG